MLFMLLPIYAPAPDPVQLTTRVVEAAVFKSGLVYLTREAMIPAGKATYKLDTIPTAIDGTFWYGSPDGLVVTDLRTSLKLVDKKDVSDPKTISQYLFANVGKRVTLVVEQNEKTATVSG